MSVNIGSRLVINVRNPGGSFRGVPAVTSSSLYPSLAEPAPGLYHNAAVQQSEPPPTYASTTQQTYTPHNASMSHHPMAPHTSVIPVGMPHHLMQQVPMTHPIAQQNPASVPHHAVQQSHMVSASVPHHVVQQAPMIPASVPHHVVQQAPMIPASVPHHVVQQAPMIPASVPHHVVQQAPMIPASVPHHVVQQAPMIPASVPHHVVQQTPLVPAPMLHTTQVNVTTDPHLPGVPPPAAMVPGAVPTPMTQAAAMVPASSRPPTAALSNVQSAGFSMYSEPVPHDPTPLRSVLTNIPGNPEANQPLHSPPPPYSASTESITQAQPPRPAEQPSEGLYPRLGVVERPSSPQPPQIPVLDEGSAVLYMDFLPKQTKKKTDYDSFDVLIQRANDWLADNKDARPMSCETVLWCGPSLDAIYSDSPAYEKNMLAGQATKCLKGFRVWYQIDDDDVIRKRLHVTTFKPRRTEDMEQMIVRVNKSIADDKSKGRLLCCEMVPHMFMSGEAYQPSQLCPARTTSKVKPEMTRKVVLCLRVYRLQTGLPDLDEFLGYEDFVPELTQSHQANGGYELLHDTMGRAASWVSRQSDVRVTNTHTLEVKIKKKDGFEKHLMWTEHPCARGRSDIVGRNRDTLYLTVVRVFYVVQAGATRARFHGNAPQITSRTFRPMGAKTRREAAMMSDGKKNAVVVGFEDISCTLARIRKWVAMTKARVHSVQTVTLRIGDDIYEKHGPEVTYRRSCLPAHDVNHQGFLFHIRVYLDGNLSESKATSKLLTPPLGVMGE